MDDSRSLYVWFFSPQKQPYTYVIKASGDYISMKICYVFWNVCVKTRSNSVRCWTFLLRWNTYTIVFILKILRNKRFPRTRNCAVNFYVFLLFNAKHFYRTRKLYIRLNCVVGIRRVRQCRVFIFFIVQTNSRSKGVINFGLCYWTLSSKWPIIRLLKTNNLKKKPKHDKRLQNSIAGKSFYLEFFSCRTYTK